MAKGGGTCVVKGGACMRKGRMQAGGTHPTGILRYGNEFRD